MTGKELVVTKPMISRTGAACSECLSIKPTSRCGILPFSKPIGGCQIVKYCGKTCQKAAWTSHKSICKPFKEIMTSGRDSDDSFVHKLILSDSPAERELGQLVNNQPLCHECNVSRNVTNIFVYHFLYRSNSISKILKQSWFTLSEHRSSL
jgi:hypothetical protein